MPLAHTLVLRCVLQVGESWNALAHIRQAVTFLVIHQKHRKSFREITEDLCASLSVQQLYRISTMYWDDRWVECRRQRAGTGWAGCLCCGRVATCEGQAY